MPCPLDCACRTNAIECYGVNLNTVYYDSRLISEMTFVDSVVDINTILQKYSKLERLTFISSSVLNCPAKGSIIIQVNNIF